MNIYIGTKIVQAEPMDDVQARAEGVLRGPGVGPGYKVVYEDGYTSWSPKETFERAYRLIPPAEATLIQGP